MTRKNKPKKRRHSIYGAGTSIVGSISMGLSILIGYEHYFIPAATLVLSGLLIMIYELIEEKSK